MKRVYVDTSVFGGCFDEEFKIASNRFFDEVQNGRFSLVLSVLLEDEISNAPEQVKEYFNSITNSLIPKESAYPNAECLELSEKYISAGIVTEKWRNDTLHVAQAVVFACDLIVSWNFKHIVHYDKIPKYNAINILNGYNEIAIYSPSEVIRYEEDV